MAEKIITAVFEVESEAYQALTELKKTSIGNDYVISQAALIKRENGTVVTKDFFDTGVESRNDAVMGGLLGAMVGILGGPIGMLLGGAWGHLAGSIVDAGDVKDNASMIENVSGQILDGETAMIVLVQENTAGSLEQKISQYKTNIIVDDAASVAAEVEKAQQMQKDMAKEAKKQLRSEKIDARKDKIEEYRNKIKEQFEKIGRK